MRSRLCFQAAGLALSVAATIVTLPVTNAHAEPTSAEKESARELLREGQELRDKGDLKGALQKLTQAHAFATTPITTLELARTHAELKHFVQARDLALSVARIPIGASESAQTQTARREAAELAEQVRPRIATLRLTFPGLPASAELTLLVDGDEITGAAARAPLRLDPGSHVIVARPKNGAEQRLEITLDESQTKDASIPLEVTEPPTTPVIAPTSPPNDTRPSNADPSPSTGTSPLVYAGFGVAIAGGALGTITGLMALSKADTSECVGTSCTSAGISDIESGRTLALVSTISFAVGLAGVGVGVYGLTFGAPKATAVRVSPSWGGLSLRGTF